MVDFDVGLGVDGLKGLAQVREIGGALEVAGVKADAFGDRLVAAMDAGTAATLREITAIRQATQVISEDVRMRREEAAALKEVADAQRAAREAANAAARARQQQMALGEQMSAELDRERRMLLLHSQALEENARRGDGFTKATHGSVAGLGNLRSELITTTKNLLSLEPAVAQVGGLLGHMALGDPILIGILGGVAAIGFAWEKLTEDAKKAKEEHQKLIEVLKDLAKEKERGVGGITGEAAAAARDDMLRLSTEIMNLEVERDRQARAGGGLFAAAGFNPKIEALKKERDELQRIVALGEERVSELEKEAGEKRLREAEERANKAKAIADEMQQFRIEDLSTSIDTADKVIAQLKRTEVAYSKLDEAAFKAGVATQKVWQDMRATVGVKAAALPETPVDWQSVFSLPSLKEAQKYSDDIAHIWGDGIERMLTDGLKSWNDFFEDVFQMFSNLMKRMQQEGNAGGFGFKALQLGSAGLAGGLAGYGAGSQIGSMVGSGGVKSALMGSFAGAATGAAAGTAVLPGVGTIVGLAVGEIAGLAGALISGSKAAKERKVAEEQLRQSLTLSLEQMRVLAGVATPLSLALTQNAEAFKSLRMQTEAAYAGRKNEAEREAKLRELTDLEAIRSAQIQQEAAAAAEEEAKRQRELAQAMREAAEATKKAAEETARAARLLDITTKQSAQLRIYDATGQSDAAFALRQQIELQDAFERGVSAAAGGMILQAQAAETAARENAKAAEAAQKVRDAQRDALQVQQQAINEQIRAQEKALDFYRDQADSLRKFSTSLSLGGFSPLSPAQKYTEARSQFEIVGALARGGDRTAIASLQDTVNAFLEASRGRFASSPGYVNDFNQAKALVDAVADQTAAQIPVQERILAELQAQSAKLQQQIAALGTINTAAQQTSNNTNTAPEDYVARYKEWYENWYNSLVYDPKTGRGEEPKNPGGPGGGKPGAGGGTPGGGGGTPGTFWSLFDPYTSATFAVAPGTSYFEDELKNYWYGNALTHQGTWYDNVGRRNPDYQTPGYALGGDFRGGIMRVGERGPELVATGAARVHTAQQLNADVVSAVKQLERKFDRLIESNDRQTRAITQTADAQRERR